MRALSLVCCCLFLPVLSAGETIPKVEIKELIKQAARFDKKWVTIEGVLDLDPQHTDYNNVLKYHPTLAGDNHLYIEGPGKTPFKKGDHIVITGKFYYHPDSFCRYNLTIEPPKGKVEKIKK